MITDKQSIKYYQVRKVEIKSTNQDFNSIVKYISRISLPSYNVEVRSLDLQVIELVYPQSVNLSEVISVTFFEVQGFQVFKTLEKLYKSQELFDITVQIYLYEIDTSTNKRTEYKSPFVVELSNCKIVTLPTFELTETNEPEIIEYDVEIVCDRFKLLKI